MSEVSKQKAWLEHYQRLLNFDWDPDHLSYQPPVEGLPNPITIDMVKKVISQMKAGKAPGPSGIVVEMIRAAGDMGASMIHDLAAAIIHDGKVPLTGSRVSLSASTKERGTHWKGQLPRSQADRAGCESPGEDCGRPHQTVGVNRRFPVWLRPRQRHYRRNLCCQAAAREVHVYLAANKRLYMAFIDLEKAFDRVPRKVIWWALRKLGVEEWIV